MTARGANIRLEHVRQSHPRVARYRALCRWRAEGPAPRFAKVPELLDRADGLLTHTPSHGPPSPDRFDHPSGATRQGLRRRTDVVGIFPNRRGPVRGSSGCPCPTGRRWATGRNCWVPSRYPHRRSESGAREVLPGCSSPTGRCVLQDDEDPPFDPKLDLTLQLPPTHVAFAES